MSSTGFSRFLAELHAQAPARKDGFDLANVRSLKGGERDQARVLLQASIAVGDATAVEPLVELDAEAGLSSLRAQLAEPSKADTLLARARIADVLLRHDGRDAQAIEALPELLGAHETLVRHSAIGSVAHLWSPDLRIALMRRCLDIEPDGMNRIAAAGELLHALGRNRGDGRQPEFTQALRELQSTDAATRASILAKLV